MTAPKFDTWLNNANAPVDYEGEKAKKSLHIQNKDQIDPINEYHNNERENVIILYELCIEFISLNMLICKSFLGG